VAFLALHPGQQRRSYVAGRLWPEVTEQRARANLRNSVWKSHGAAPGLLECGGDTIGLAASVDVDVTIMRRVADALLHHGASVDPIAYADLFGEEILIGWDDDWALFERERLKQLSLHALEALSERCLESRAFASAIDAALLAVKLEPLRESAHRAVSRAHLVEGNPVQAWRQFHLYRDLLATDLGIAPSAAYWDLVSIGDSQFIST
jgi:DNA-binding SARP family transcriptional activator